MASKNRINSNFQQIAITDLNGNVNGLTVSGDITAGSFQGDGSNISNVAASSADHANTANTAFSVDGANVVGQVADSAHADIADAANVAYSVDGANVVGDVAGSNHANIADAANVAYSVDGANVVGQVANALVADSALSVAGANVVGDVAGANYANFAGDVVNAAQPNITSVGNLVSLAATGDITTDGNISAVGGMTALDINVTDLYVNGGTAQLGDVSTVQITGGSADQYLQTDGTGNLIWATLDVANATVANANYANFAGEAFSVSGANVSGEVANANYANFAGDVVNASQPNITSVGNLTSLTVAGDALITGNLSVSGNLTYIDVTDLRIQDPVIQLGRGANGAPLTSNDGKDRGTQLHVFDTGANAEIDKFIGWKDTAGEFVFGSNITNANDVITINSYGNVRADTFIGNLQGTAANASLAYALDSDVANVSITGGSNAQVLTTDGTGNLTWTTPTVFTPLKYTKEFHVDTYNGNDTTGNGSYEKPFKTIMKAHSVMDGSGQALYIHGGVYSEAVTWTRVNADIIGINDGGISYLQGAWTVSPASSSVRIRNVMWGTTASLTHNTAGSLYLTQCTFSPVAFNKTGTGYVQLQDCDLGSASSVSVTGAGQFVVDGGMISNITLNNASALVSTVSCLNVRGITVTAGIYSSKGSVIYSTGPTANAITAASGTTVYLFETAVYTPASLPARLSLAGNWSINSSQYDKTNSTLTGTNIGTVTHWDAINVHGVSTLGAVGNVRITGGSNTQVLSTNGSGNLSWTSSIANANYANTANTANSATVAASANSVAGANVSGTVANATYAVSSGTANSATVAASANSVAGSNVVGEVANAAYATSAGTANSATVAASANSVAGGNVVGAVANATYAVSSGTADSATVAASANSVAGANVVGAVANATFADASQVAYGLDTDTANIIIYGGSAGQALVTDGAGNVSWATVDSSNANYANFAGEAYSVAVANVVGIGNIATINLDGNVANVLAGDGTWIAAGGAAALEQPMIEFTANLAGGSGQSFTDANLVSFSSTDQAMVFVNGVLQRVADYSISGNTLTFTGYLASQDLISVGPLSGFAGNGGGGNGGPGTSWTSTAAIAVGDIFAGQTTSPKTPGAIFTPSSSLSVITEPIDITFAGAPVSIGLDSTSGTLMIGGTLSGTAMVYRSLDNGLTYTRMISSQTASIAAMTHGNGLWVTNAQLSGGQIGVSTDNGTTWTNYVGNASMPIQASLVYSPTLGRWASGSVSGSSIWTTSDPTTAWTSQTSPIPNSRSLFWAPFLSKFFLSTASSVYSSSTALTGSWTTTTVAGMTANSSRMACSSTSLIIACGAGIVARTTNGTSWSLIQTPFTSFTYNMAAYDPVKGVYIVSNGSVSCYSADDGITWSIVKIDSNYAGNNQWITATNAGTFIQIGSGYYVNRYESLADSIYTTDNEAVPSGSYRCLGMTGGYGIYDRLYGGLWTRTA